MKRILNRISILLVVMMLATGAAFAAEASVTYEGGAENYVFLPGSEYTETDLFDNFKGVMPGDTLEQEITVQNNNDDCDRVNIYMRAVAHDGEGNPISESVAKSEDLASMNDFLHQLSLTVVTEGGKTIFEGTAEELDGLAENVLIGTFEQGESTVLTAKLSVPIELGNKYANRVGEVDWVFVAEEINDPEPPVIEPDEPTEEPDEPVVEPEEPEKPGKTPFTGDTSRLMLYAGMLAAAGAALMILIGKRKGQN